MSHNGSAADTSPPGKSLELQGETASPGPDQSASAATGATRSDLRNYSDLQSAARFPIKLPIFVKSKSGESRTETENISANGVLFQVDAEMPVGSPVDFTISLPAHVLGAESDVQLDCHGRVARSFEDGGRRGVGVVIDEYHFERR